ncbi:MAG: N-acetylmuramoyl-L-alanine amidase [Candidatus Moranbacteria bacterium]|nr:N-acetylmuramoyl-L-alanine amidase [Candidatus Moranbacteria bacterium]
MKKIALILAICVACSAGIFFGVRKLGQSKKTISVSVAELSQQASGVDEQSQQEDITGGQVVNKDVNAEQIENVPATQEAAIEKEQEVVPKEKQVTPENKTNSTGKIVSKLVSWGFAKSSNRKIDTIIVHSSYNSLGGDEYSPDKIIGIYKQYEVSAHYLIGRDGTVYRLVEDGNIAWHAGVSKVPDGRTNINDFSIGIEMINTMDGKYTEQQYDALNQLIKSLKSKYEIKYILGHSEIAPGRKTDPWGIQWNNVDR